MGRVASAMPYIGNGVCYGYCLTVRDGAVLSMTPTERLVEAKNSCLVSVFKKQQQKYNAQNMLSKVCF